MEPRLLMATSGGRWSNQAIITYSFAPDGTSIGGIPNSLNGTLNAKFSTATWQQQFQRAAAVWEAVANVNIAQVGDDGSAFGVYGDQQGDPRFGDIRIGGTPGNPNTLATTFLPPAFNGGTLAGDMVINTSQAWKINNDYDLQTVAIHEFGHALGMDHSAIAAAVMYASYNGMKQSLTSDDTTSMQSIYGQRTQDSDNAYQNATVVNLDSQGQATLTGVDIAASTDLDWFRVVAPSTSTGTMTVTMQSTGLSSLSPKMTVFNGSMQTVATASSTAYGATITATITGATAGQTYYVRAQSAAGGPSGSGAYGVQFNFGSGPMEPVPAPTREVPWQPDQGGGSSNLETGHPGPARLALGSLTGWGETLSARSTSRPGFRRMDGAGDGSTIGAIAPPDAGHETPHPTHGHPHPPRFRRTAGHHG